MFSVHTSLEKFENATLDLCLKMCSVHIETQSRRFQIPRVSTVFSFEERPFSWQIVAEGIKAVFLNISGVVWTKP